MTAALSVGLQRSDGVAWIPARHLAGHRQLAGVDLAAAHWALNQSPPATSASTSCAASPLSTSGTTASCSAPLVTFCAQRLPLG